MASERITETATEHALRAVRESGGRLTSPTRTVIAVLADADGHLTAEDVINEVNTRLPNVAPSTIYRVIQRLSDLELIEHVHTSVGPPIYHLREHGHAHLVCNSCGSIADISDDHLAALQGALVREFGFTLAPRHSALVGYCKDCAPTPGHHTH